MNNKDNEKVENIEKDEKVVPMKPKATPKPKAKPKAETKAKPKADAKPKANAKKPEMLNAKALQKEVSQLDLQGTAPITIGDTVYEISYDKVFRKTKQRNMLQDMIDFFKDMGTVEERDADFATAYTTLLLIKHFTSLDVPDDIKGALDMLEVLIDLEVFGQILEVLPEEEVVKAFDLLSDSVKSMTERYNEITEEMKEQQAQIENKELQEYIEEMEPVEVTVEDIAQDAPAEETETKE